MPQRYRVGGSGQTVIGLCLFFSVTCTPLAWSDELVRRGYFGTVISPISPDVREKHKLPQTGGVIVDRILPDSSAAISGLKAGDILISFDGRAITSPAQFIAALAARRVGETLELVTIRDGQQTTKSVALKPVPLETSEASRINYGSVVSRGKRLRTIIGRPMDDRKHPALFLIQGLGSFSVENLPGRPGPYARIVDEFARLGFVTIRVDKPGQGDSEGGPTRDIDFETELDGYRQTLKMIKGLDFVDQDHVILFGHSMGGLIAPILGSEIPVKGISVYGSVARTWQEYSQENVRRQLTLSGLEFTKIDETLRQDNDINHFIQEGLSPAEIVARRPDLKEQVDDRYVERKYHAATHYEYFRQLGSRNLAEPWAKYEGQTLAIWGKSDFISSEEDHALIARIVNRTHPGHGLFIALDGIDHAFRRASSVEDSFKNFGKADREYNPAFLKAFLDWASKVVRD